MSIPAHDPDRSRWIPWVFVGGMLLVVLVNGVLIFQALTTFTGVTVGGAYDRGRGYNRVLEEAARQDALAWQLRVSVEAGRVTLTARDPADAPIAGVLEAHLLRPLDGERIALPDVIGAGRFVLDLPELRPGQWELRGLLTSAAGERHDVRWRFTLP